MTSAVLPYEAGEGSMMRLTDSEREVTPAQSTMAEMMIVVRYSMRPWPKGCARSGSFSDRRVPTMVMIDESASERLFTASRTIAIDPVMVPMAAFMAESSMFPTTPTMDARTMSAPRLWAPSVAEAFPCSV